MGIRLAPTGVERRSEIPIKLQVVSNLEQVIMLRCETCSKRECLPLIMGILVRQIMEKQGVTEELKARDQMVWVGAVNNIQNAAEEIVLKELVYI